MSAYGNYALCVQVRAWPSHKGQGRVRGSLLKKDKNNPEVNTTHFLSSGIYKVPSATEKRHSSRGAGEGHVGDSPQARGSHVDSEPLPSIEGGNGKNPAELLFWDKHIPRICLSKSSLEGTM